MIAARRLLMIAAAFCFLLALIVDLGGSIGSSSSGEWLAGGLLSWALDRVIP